MPTSTHIPLVKSQSNTIPTNLAPYKIKKGPQKRTTNTESNLADQETVKENPAQPGRATLGATSTVPRSPITYANSIKLYVYCNTSNGVMSRELQNQGT